MGDLSADRAAVSDALGQLVGVVLVGHPGGGMVLAELADHPKVAHSVHVTALHPQEGQSVSDLFDGQKPGWVVVREDGVAQVSGDADVVRQALRADVDAENFEREVHPRYVLTSLSSLQAASTGPERTHPASYVGCEQDEAIPIEAQEAMASTFDRVERLPSLFTQPCCPCRNAWRMPSSGRVPQSDRREQSDDVPSAEGSDGCCRRQGPG